MSSLTYAYPRPSALVSSPDSDRLFLSKFNEEKKKQGACFFWGRLTDPYHTARCLITLSKIVQSNFMLTAEELSRIKDPIVTSGNGKIRMEAFSVCAGVYARTDIMEGGHDGEFLENGTTNVDFNIPLVTALNQIQQSDQLVLSVGDKEVGFHKEGESIIERKVPLPTKWIKGLTTVQHFLAESEEVAVLTRVQALALFRTVRMSKVKTDYHLVKRGTKYQFSPSAHNSLACVGGMHRLALLQPLLPMISALRIYRHEHDQAVSFVLEMGEVHFTFSISRNYFRGFSGEGAVLDDLIEDLPADLISAFDHYSFANQEYDHISTTMAHDLDFSKIEKLSAKLAAMGLLGYDLQVRKYYYRRLPFKLNRILSLNPRLKGAQKLLEEHKVLIKKRSGDRVEASVKGSQGFDHFVLLEGDTEKCTCLWYSRHQGERGSCKHVLAVKKMILNN